MNRRSWRPRGCAAVMAAVALALAGCASDDAPAADPEVQLVPYPHVIVIEREVPGDPAPVEDAWVPPDDTWVAPEDDAGPVDDGAAPEDDAVVVEDSTDDAVDAPDAARPVEDVPVVEPPPPTGPGGETDGLGLVVDPVDLEGVFLYGVSVEPGSPLGTVGQSAIGVLVIHAVVELDDGEAVIRVWDTDAGGPVQGKSGLVEAYPYTTLEDGRVRIDFELPTVGLEIQFFRDCVYVMQGYTPAAEPVYEGGLMTWQAVELYGSEACGNAGLESSLGLNVHFLRRTDVEVDYAPRAVDPESPFGFFVSEAGDAPYMSRLPGIGPESEDDSVVYLLSHNFPEHLRPVAHQVFDDWNDVLEEAAGNRPFALLDADPDVVAWDPRHRVVSWDPSKTQGAIAPFLDDPTTGEMFDTDVIVWLGELDELLDKYGDFFDDHPDVADWLDEGEGDGLGQLPPAGWDDDEGRLEPRVLRRRAYPGRPFRLGDVARFQQRVGMSFDADELEALIIADFLTHEVGHNLGLRHNFKGSIDKDHHPEDETATTTMDYVVGMVAPGTYDQDAMRHGYGAGPDVDTYLYCTDEHTDTDPGCGRWDFGHPVVHFLGVTDRLVEEYPPGTDEDEIEDVAEEDEWGKLFNRVRQFVGTDYELWDPEGPVDTFSLLLERVVCEEPCEMHPWFRDRFALYLLFTKFVAYNEWHEFPPLSEEQATTLLDTYFVLVTDPAKPARVKETIIAKLPTSGVPGAPELLDDLEAWFEALEEPSEAELDLLALIKAAKAG